MTLCDPNPAGERTAKDAVLIVDDEQPLLDIYSAVLESRFAVTTAGNAAEAESRLRSSFFKVILADHSMPGERGLSFLVRMRMAFPRVQSVLITGFLEPEMRVTADAAGVFCCLSKPVSMGVLIGVVNDAIRAHDGAALIVS